MTEIELTTLNNIIKQIIADIDNTFALNLFEKGVNIRFINGIEDTEPYYYPVYWKFDRIINNKYIISITITIDEIQSDPISYKIDIDSIIYNANMLEYSDFNDCQIEYGDFNNYKADNVDIDKLANYIKQSYNIVMADFNADIAPENTTILTEAELNAITNTIKQIIPKVDSELRINEEHFNINTLRLYLLNYQKLIEDNIICGILITLDKQGRDYIVVTDCYVRQIINCNTDMPYKFESFSTKLINNKVDNIDEYINNIKRIYNNTLHQYTKKGVE